MTPKTDTGSGSAGQETSKEILRLGEQTEYRIARLFVWMGYFVRRGRNICAEGDLDHAAELDVLAVRYRGLFSKEVIAIDSKPRGQGPLDRVLRLAGVRQYIKADRALLFKAPTKSNIRDLAKQAGVEVLDPDRLAELENRYVREPALWPGLCDWEFLHARADSWNKILATNAKYRELFQALAAEVRYAEPFAFISFWIPHLRGLVSDCAREKDSAQELVRYLISDAAGQLAVAFLRVAQATADLAIEDRQELIYKKLIFGKQEPRLGEQEPRLVERVFDNAYQIAKAAIGDKSGTGVEFDRSLFSVPNADSYVAAIVYRIDDLVADGEAATDLPQTVDIMMSEWFLKGNRAGRALKRLFPNEGLALRTGIAQNFLRTLHDLGALPPMEELLAITLAKDGVGPQPSILDE